MSALAVDFLNMLRHATWTATVSTPFRPLIPRTIASGDALATSDADVVGRGCGAIDELALQVALAARRGAITAEMLTVGHHLKGHPLTGAHQLTGPHFHVRYR